MFIQNNKYYIRGQIADKRRLYISNKIIRNCHLLDPRWNGLFLITCQVLSIPLGNESKFYPGQWIPCEVNPLTYVNALNISFKDLNYHL